MSNPEPNTWNHHCNDHDCILDNNIIIENASIIDDTPVTPCNCPLKTKPILVKYE
jgi:hypothetical protein